MTPAMHDIFVMLATAFAIFFGIRRDLKSLKATQQVMFAMFQDHINKYHGERNE